MMKLELFKIRNFWVSNVITLLTAFGMFGILPLSAGDQLFQTIKVLETGQQRLLGQASSTR